MGFSASADIFYGVMVYDLNSYDDDRVLPPWKSEDYDEETGDEIESEYDDFDDWYIKTFTDLRDDSDYELKLDELQKLVITSDFYGYLEDNGTEFLKLKGWGYTAYGYGIEEIQFVPPTEEQKQQFKDEIERLGLSHFGEPAIHLAASYG